MFLLVKKKLEKFLNVKIYDITFFIILFVMFLNESLAFLNDNVLMSRNGFL